MFTPQRKGWSVSPRVAPSGDGRSKGKAVADEVLPPPPTASLEGNGPRGGDGDAGDWTSFRDAGFLDKSALQRRDREALVGRIAELEKERMVKSQWPQSLGHQLPDQPCRSFSWQEGRGTKEQGASYLVAGSSEKQVVAAREATDHISEFFAGAMTVDA